VTRYTVDGFGQRTVLSSPDTGVSTFAFDGAGNLTSSTDARNAVTSYVYDVAGRVTRAGTGSFEYGPGGTVGAGRLTVMRDDSGRTEFGYDGFGRLISKTQTVTGPSVRTFKVGYTYGATGASTGHMSSVTYPSGNRIDIGYDSSGRPNTLRLLARGVAQPVFLLRGIVYRPFGAVNGWAWGDGTAQPSAYARVFDLQGNLVSYPLGYSGKNGVMRSLHYDAAGRITGTTHTGTARANALDQTYSYDDLDRLTGFNATGTSQRYAYDQNGNRSQITFGGTSYVYALSTTSNRLNATAGPAPRKINTYDKAGNLTGDGTISYTYGANGRMETASSAGVTTRYRYNGRGERVVKTSSAGTTYYVYDEQGHLLGEYDATGTPRQETIYLGDLPVAVIKPGVSGPAVYYVYTDHLHAPRVLTRASDQQMVWRWDHAGRLAYAGIAKVGSVLAASGAEASAFRQGMKGVFRLGAAKNWRPPDLSRYPTDEALRAAAGRTNPGMNAYGAGVAAAGAVGAMCGCPK
jgi:YD repeat-containing protein